MGSSFIDANSRGFWCSDGLFEIWAYRIYEQLAGDSDPALTAYREHLRVQATVGMSGCKYLGVDDLPAAAREKIADCAERLPDHLRRHPETLTAMELNGLGLGGPGSAFTSDVPLEDMLRLSQMIIGVLRGREGWPANAKEALPAHWLHRDEPDAAGSP